MACSNLNGAVLLSCSNNVGGVSKIYIANEDDVTSVTDGSPAGIIDTITMTGGATFYAFESNPETSSFVENLVKNLESGATFYDQVVTIKIPRRDYQRRNTLNTLTQGRFKMIVKDANGLFWYLGEVNSMIMTKNDSGSGTKREDGSSYTLEIKAIGEYDPAKEVDAAAVAAVI